jgi:hypothetical protein
LSLTRFRRFRLKTAAAGGRPVGRASARVAPDSRRGGTAIAFRPTSTLLP